MRYNRSPVKIREKCSNRFHATSLLNVVLSYSGLSQFVLPKFVQAQGKPQQPHWGLQNTIEAVPGAGYFHSTIPHYTTTVLCTLQLHQIQVVLYLLLLLDLAQFQAAKSTAPDAAGVSSPVNHLVVMSFDMFWLWLRLGCHIFLVLDHAFLLVCSSPSRRPLLRKSLQHGTISYKRMIVGICRNWVPSGMTFNFPPWDHGLTNRAEHSQHADLESIVKRYLRKRHARHVRVACTCSGSSRTEQDDRYSSRIHRLHLNLHQPLCRQKRDNPGSSFLKTWF